MATKKKTKTIPDIMDFGLPVEQQYRFVLSAAIVLGEAQTILLCGVPEVPLKITGIQFNAPCPLMYIIREMALNGNPITTLFINEHPRSAIAAELPFDPEGEMTMFTRRPCIHPPVLLGPESKAWENDEHTKPRSYVKLHYTGFVPNGFVKGTQVMATVMWRGVSVEH